MCEFKVMLNGRKVFEDAVHAKEENGNLTLRNILGQTKELRKCRIVEVNVEKEELTVKQTET